MSERSGAERASHRGMIGDPEPLSGFTVAVTADRRRDELAALLERRGARVVLAPALRIVPLSDDVELRATTASLVDSPPDVVVACTGIGLRGWLEAAEGWGLAERLKMVVGNAYLVARGDTPVQANPVPRGLMTWRQAGPVRSRTAPLVRVPRTLPRILSPGRGGPAAPLQTGSA